jgi:hypothetical protein
MSSLPQISTELSFAFLLGFIVSTLAVIVQFVNSRNSAHQVSQTSIMKAIEIMETSRIDRHILYSIRESKKRFSEWDANDRKAANNVVRAFDILGVLDNCNNIGHNFVDRFYAFPAIEIWDICKPFIDEERKHRGITYVWEFEHFVTQIKNVRMNHPTLSKKKNWPRYPRHKYFHF